MISGIRVSDLKLGSKVTLRGEAEQIVVTTPAPPLNPGQPVPTAIKSEALVAPPPNPPQYHDGPATLISASGAIVSSASMLPFDSVSTQDEGGQAGVVVIPGSTGGNGSVYVAMTAYDNFDMNYPPAGSTALDALYSPTTHGPNGDCLELGADYWFGNTGFTDTARYVRLYDFCDKGGTFKDEYDKQINSSFINSYVRVFTNGNGYPEFTSEQMLESDGKWHALIYNYSTSAWEDWGWSDAGKYTGNGEDGWSIFETHYAAGQTCSAVPMMSTDGLRVYVSGGWQLVDSTMGIDNSDYMQCFSPSVPTYYSPTTTQNYYQWTVASITPSPAPTPSPIHTPTGPICDSASATFKSANESPNEVAPCKPVE